MNRTDSLGLRDLDVSRDFLGLFDIFELLRDDREEDLERVLAFERFLLSLDPFGLFEGFERLLEDDRDAGRNLIPNSFMISGLS